MNRFQETQSLPAVLFPSAYLQETNLKKILSFFGPLTIFQPWHMDRRILLSESKALEPVQVVNPPVDLKPMEGFRRVLSNFKSWIGANPDQGYNAFLSARGGIDQDSEDSTWEIRKAVRRGIEKSAEPKPSPVLKWHLALHLAQEIEDERQEADALLRGLREKDSPLKGVVEEGGGENLFYDLPAFGKEPVMEENQLEQVYEAWFSLFGGFLKEQTLLVTMNQQVMDHVSGIWHEYVTGDGHADEMSVAFRAPDLSHLSLEDLLSAKAQVFGRPFMGEVRKAIMAFSENPIGSVTVLKQHANEIEKAFPEGLRDGSLMITANYLKPGVPRKKRGLLRRFSGKTIILVSEEATS